MEVRGSVIALIKVPSNPPISASVPFWISPWRPLPIACARPPGFVCESVFVLIASVFVSVAFVSASICWVSSSVEWEKSTAKPVVASANFPSASEFCCRVSSVPPRDRFLSSNGVSGRGVINSARSGYLSASFLTVNVSGMRDSVLSRT